MRPYATPEQTSGAMASEFDEWVAAEQYTTTAFLNQSRLSQKSAMTIYDNIARARKRSPCAAAAVCSGLLAGVRRFAPDREFLLRHGSRRPFPLVCGVGSSRPMESTLGPLSITEP